MTPPQRKTLKKYPKITDNLSMKLRVIFYLFSLLASPLLWAENAIPVGGVPDAVEGPQGSLQANQNRLELILESGAAKEKYDQCKELLGTDKLDAAVSDCLWDGKIPDPSDSSKTIVSDAYKLSEDEKGAVTEQLEAVGENYKGDSPDMNKDKFESLDSGFLKEAKKDPAFKKLNEYLTEKLKKEIYGEAEKGKLKVADHMVYHELYKSQLSKNVIQAISSYCLDADVDNDYLIPKLTDDLKKLRKKNIERLKSQDVDPATNQPLAQSHYNKCMGNLKHICYGTGVIKDRDSSGNPQSYSTLNGNDDYDLSKTRACNVVTYMKQIKQNIIALDGIKKKMDDIGIARGQGVRLGLDQGQELKEYDSNKNEQITTLTSKELVEESGFKEANDEKKQEFEKCMDDTGKIVDESLCEEFVSTDQAEREEAAKLLAEADLRSRGMQKRIADNVQDEEGVTKYLTDQGYTEEEISQMKNDPNIVNKLVSEINKRYEAEREAYIKSVSDKLKGKVAEVDSVTGQQKNLDTEDKLKNIKEELTSRTDRYTELIHFNNIVSGFIETEDGEGNSGSNTTGMALELAGSAYGSGSGAPQGGPSPASASDPAAHVKAIQDALSANGITPEVQETTNTIKQGDINKILEYDANAGANGQNTP